jgi:hypothetical protein
MRSPEDQAVCVIRVAARAASEAEPVHHHAPIYIDQKIINYYLSIP